MVENNKSKLDALTLKDNFMFGGDKSKLEKAVKECIKENILADYLGRKSEEVVNMLMAEYDYETDIEVHSQEAEERGEKRGRAEGRSEGIAEAILVLLESLPDEVPDDLREYLFAEKNSDVLHRYLKLAASAASVEEFEQQIRQ